MYIIRIMYNNKSIGSVATKFEDETFFNFLYSLEVSGVVRQFTVPDSGGIMTNDHFGYGGLHKWVEHFDYKDKEL
jgi:hypothetical protein